MKRSRLTEEQIIGVLREHRVGAPAVDLCRKHGITDTTFYTWRSKYGDSGSLETVHLKALEKENAKLKKLLGESVLEVSMLREMLAEASDARRGEISSAPYSNGAATAAGSSRMQRICRTA
jgi:putative transposase